MAAKTESAAGPVVPRGSVLLQQVASSSTAVQTDNTEDALGLAHNLHYDDGNPNVSSGNIPAVEFREGFHLNFINYDMLDPRQPLPAGTPTTVLGPSSAAAGRHTNICARAATKTNLRMTRPPLREVVAWRWQHAVPFPSLPKGECSIFAPRNAQHPNGDASRHIGGGEGMKSALVVTP